MSSDSDHTHLFCWLVLVVAHLFISSLTAIDAKHEHRLRTVELELNITVPADWKVEIEADGKKMEAAP